MTGCGRYAQWERRTEMSDYSTVPEGTAAIVAKQVVAANTKVMKVGFIGLGHMGSGMAASLLKAGHRVTVYNRTPAKAKELIAQGAKAAGSIAEACQGDAVITMLANDQAVESVVFGKDGVIAHLPRGGLHLSSSTISVDLSQRLTEEHARSGQRFVATPVFGRPDAAVAGKLFIVAGGEPEALEFSAPLLKAMGQKAFVISDKPKAASLAKLTGNFLGASVIEALGEALTLVAKGGIDQRRYLEFLTSTLYDAPIYRTYGALIAGGHFKPAGFAAPLGQKDIRLVLAAAEDLRVPMPVASLLRDRFLTLLAHGGDELDWSAIGGLPAADAGITHT
jgi:3-hydroxyisobutyrate dehydrogenase-like beta-hydroxyacid dehydrogenase